MPKTIKHILVIRLSAMGDVAMTIPVLRAFTQQYPNVKITVLTRGFFNPFFRDLPNVTVFSPDLKGKHKGIFGLLKLSRTLAKLNIDENPKTPIKYHVKGIPTLTIFKDGSIQDTKVGALSKSQLIAFIDSTI